MLEKGLAPIAAYESDPEAIAQRSEMEMERNKTKNIQRETVDGGHQVPLAADGSKVKLRQSVARRSSLGGLTYDAILFNSVFRAKTSWGSERPSPGYVCVRMMKRGQEKN